jgi:hypothetical protein
MPSVVTANILRTGGVVYLKSDGTWVEQLADADVAHDKATMSTFEELALASIERNEVTAVYAFDVVIVDGRPLPASVREKIRAAHAPTV